MLRLYSILVTMFFGVTGISADREMNVVVLGDSVTMGVWADTKLGAPNRRFYWQSLRAEVAGIVHAFVRGIRVNDLSNAATYSRLIDRYFSFIARKNLSGIIGDQDFSLKNQLEMRLGVRVNLVEATVLAGSYQISGVLFEKLQKLRNMGRVPEPVNLVIIDFHGMDVVFKGEVAGFRSDVQKTLVQVSRLFPDAMVVVSPLLDVTSMVLSVAAELTIPASFLRPAVTCREAYDKIGFSESLGLFGFAPSTSYDEYLSTKRQRYEAMQMVLAEELSSFSAHEPPYSEFRGEAIQARQRTIGFSEWRGLLAADCIHPNMAGQQLLVEDVLVSLGL